MGLRHRSSGERQFPLYLLVVEVIRLGLCHRLPIRENLQSVVRHRRHSCQGK